MHVLHDQMRAAHDSKHAIRDGRSPKHDDARAKSKRVQDQHERVSGAASGPRRRGQVRRGLARVVEGDDARFNEALELHRDYWIERTTVQPDIQDAVSFLPLGPAAMTTLAQDRGIPVRVLSDYLAPWVHE
jgi:hypothetical protein